MSHRARKLSSAALFFSFTSCDGSNSEDMQDELAMKDCDCDCDCDCSPYDEKSMG